jgi:hypothetical protein
MGRSAHRSMIGSRRRGPPRLQMSGGFWAACKVASLAIGAPWVSWRQHRLGLAADVGTTVSMDVHGRPDPDAAANAVTSSRFVEIACALAETASGPLASTVGASVRRPYCHHRLAV